MRTERVWIAEDDDAIRFILAKALQKEGMDVEVFSDGAQLLDKLMSSQPQVVISDIRMPHVGGLPLLQHFQEHHPDIPMIIMTAHSDLESAISAYEKGAFEYLPKPFDIQDAIELVKRALAHQAPSIRQHENQTESMVGIIGQAPAMQDVFRAIGRLSRSSMSVLINGESGTGKELVANALHQHSPRKDALFIALNMAAIPHDLVESELFGHEKGAFTGANQMRKGRFEQADRGTLFLDEIGDMPLSVQTRLLRVLAEGQFYRVGGHMPVHVNVRIIAATHQNLESLVQQNKFREDLFHRLNVIRIQVPALRERREDIPALTDFFLKQATKELQVEPKHISAGAMRQLCDYGWPGNVRQLENTCRWLCVMAASHEVMAEDLPDELHMNVQVVQTDIMNDWQHQLALWIRKELEAGRQEVLSEVMPQIERTFLQEALRFTNGKKLEAAQVLGWGRNTLTRKLKLLEG
ncbi:nitrogen regulation protein NR(I) [Algicola sagamiensis]|uniref:nitrogen regulation protein NR(I) n=1 Tax=Algicola sagamiensis TaxID=163869 RepID=UPI00038129DD|nr:nitrogen regulation protein NR(I) [Algicola sagamiensis]